MVEGMRSTCSLYIDAGYLLAASATRATGTSLRAGINVNYSRLIEILVEQAEKQSGLPVLRVHWYDSAQNGVPDAQQERIGELSKVKLRLGRFGREGQQKGVDLRIGLDLVAHARNAASDVFFLVSGDDDLTEAVEEAQVHGVQVIVLAVPTVDGRPHGVSRHLIRAADELDQIDGVGIDGTVVRVEVPRRAEPEPAALPETAAAPSAAVKSAGPSPLDIAARRRGAASAPQAPPPLPSATLAYSGATGRPSQVYLGYGADEVDEQVVTEVVERVLASFKQSATPDDLLELRRARPSIPRDIDKALLIDASDVLGIYDLSEPIRYRLRSRFWEIWEDD